MNSQQSNQEVIDQNEEQEEQQLNAFSRQEGAVNMAKIKELKVTIIGCGSIGSYSALALSKLGVGSLFLVDFDEVNKHNVSTQLFSLADIGLQKCYALEENIMQFCPDNETYVEGVNLQITEEESPYLSGSDVVVFAVDSLEARREAFISLVNNPPNTEDLVDNRTYLIDGRMGLNNIEILFTDLSNLVSTMSYAETLKGEQVNLPCTARGIGYSAQIIGGMVAAQVALLCPHGQDLPDFALLDSWRHFNVKGHNTIAVRTPAEARGSTEGLEEAIKSQSLTLSLIT